MSALRISNAYKTQTPCFTVKKMKSNRKLGLIGGVIWGLPFFNWFIVLCVMLRTELVRFFFLSKVANPPRVNIP